MTDRFLTIQSLSVAAPAPPSLFDLRLIERRLRARLAELDGRVDVHLALAAPPFAGSAAEVDILCSAILEARELLDETEREIALALARSRARRNGRRTWG